MSNFAIEKDNENNNDFKQKNTKNYVNNSKDTLVDTKALTNNFQNTQKVIPKNINESNEYNFSKKENLEQYLNDNYKSFSEQFELIDFINQGSYGYVYKIRYKKSINKDIYALKFFYKKKSKEKKNKEKIEINKKKNDYSEVSIQKKFHHKNINKILAFSKINEYSFFTVLEIGKYGDLFNFMKNILKRETLTETVLNYFGKQILDGLQYIHSRKIIHLDIKPGNIIIDSDLIPKIIDFSASCSYESFNQDDIVKFPFIGTGKFMAPEIINKTSMKVNYAEKIDIYSFGVTIYYLLYGDYPYDLNNVDGKNYDEILKKKQTKELQFPKEIKISKLLKDFLKGLLEKDYEKRLNIRESLEHPWIKGYQILDEEKQNIANQNIFIIKLITDSVLKFNEYLR